MAGVGDVKFVVKTPKEFFVRDAEMVGEDAEDFLGEGVLGNAVVVVEARLRPPADIEGGEGVGLAPLHDFANFVPVRDVFKGHLLHRRAGHEEAVVFAVPDLGEGAVKFRQVFLGGVLGEI